MGGHDSFGGMDLSATYHVVRQIARGGMGAIYEATHLRLPDKRYAIKVLSPKRVDLDAGVDRAARELPQPPVASASTQALTHALMASTPHLTVSGPSTCTSIPEGVPATSRNVRRDHDLQPFASRGAS